MPLKTAPTGEGRQRRCDAGVRMDLTSGARTTATAAVVVMLGGLSLTAHGMWRDQAPHSLAGVVLSMIGLTIIILGTIRHWITDTSTERIALGAAQRQAQEERRTYIAAKAALENDHARLYQDLAADRAADAQRLKAEREAMWAELEDARTDLVNEAMTTLATWIVGGKVRPPERRADNLNRFPHQGQEPQHQPERAQEHGAAGS